MTTFGIDYAWGRPGVDALHAAGVKFVARYLSHDAGKNLSRDEADALSKAGIGIVVVWETTANRALAGHDAGVNDARAALSQATACGMPAGRPIYFAVDFDGSAGQQDAINAYLDGAAFALGRARVGLYAGYHVIKRAFDAKRIAYGWQTYAWSGGHWDGRAQLQQYSNGHRLNGVGVDYNRATATDFGQWRVGVTPTSEGDDDMDPTTSVTIPAYWLDPKRTEFSHKTYSAAFLWAAAVAEVRSLKKMVAAQSAAVTELVTTVGELASNTHAIDVDALVGRIQTAIDNVTIHLDAAEE